MANDGLLDVDAIRETMKDAPLSAQDHLENMLKKGVDETFLSELKALPIPDDILNVLKESTDAERMWRLELLVERLLIRVARLERENEERSLEIITLSLELSKFIGRISPMITNIFTHFFSEG